MLMIDVRRLGTTVKAKAVAVRLLWAGLDGGKVNWGYDDKSTLLLVSLCVYKLMVTDGR